MKYQAKLYREGKFWNVEFPDCPGCVNFGSSRAKAMKMAAEALEGWLKSTLERGLVPPVPAYVGAARVTINAALMLSVFIRVLRTGKGISQARLAEASGLTQQQISRVERPGANPTMKTLQAIAAALKADLSFEMSQVA